MPSTSNLRFAAKALVRSALDASAYGTHVVFPSYEPGRRQAFTLACELQELLQVLERHAYPLYRGSEVVEMSTEVSTHIVRRLKELALHLRDVWTGHAYIAEDIENMIEDHRCLGDLSDLLINDGLANRDINDVLELIDEGQQDACNTSESTVTVSEQ
jgi:hypothetical protein